ncbi:hypothetical protein Syun_027982 [Stephania yunnanensis]|uniref:Uncharacterized protein n=1 Tax=Stephania yunnanensis TaxID=152371 RepID=A0AAP0EGJ6_9MAGN
MKVLNNLTKEKRRIMAHQKLLLKTMAVAKGNNVNFPPCKHYEKNGHPPFKF